jgi:hypothetical protein
VSHSQLVQVPIPATPARTVNTAITAQNKVVLVESERDEIDRICRLLWLDNLKAQLMLREIERLGLNAQIDSPDTTPKRRAEAIARRDASLVEWAKLFTELEDLRNSHYGDY